MTESAVINREIKALREKIEALERAIKGENTKVKDEDLVDTK